MLEILRVRYIRESSMEKYFEKLQGTKEEIDQCLLDIYKTQDCKLYDELLKGTRCYDGEFSNKNFGLWKKYIISMLLLLAPKKAKRASKICEKVQSLAISMLVKNFSYEVRLRQMPMLKTIAIHDAHCTSLEFLSSLQLQNICFDRCILPDGLQGLWASKSIKYLSIYDSEILQGNDCKIESSSINEISLLNTKIESLQQLGVKVSTLKCLSITKCDIKYLRDFAIENIDLLFINECSLIKELSSLPRKIDFLNIQSCACIEKVIMQNVDIDVASFSQCSIPHLEVTNCHINILRLDKVNTPSLQNFHDNKIDSLDIVDCPQLKNVPSTSKNTFVDEKH